MILQSLCLRPTFVIFEDDEAEVLSFRYRPKWPRRATVSEPTLLYLGKYYHPKTGSELIGGLQLNMMTDEELERLRAALPQILRRPNLKTRYWAGYRLFPIMFGKYKNQGFYRTYRREDIKGKVTRDTFKLYDSIEDLEAAEDEKETKDIQRSTDKAQALDAEVDQAVADAERSLERRRELERERERRRLERIRRMREPEEPPEPPEPPEEREPERTTRDIDRELEELENLKQARKEREPISPVMKRRRRPAGIERIQKRKLEREKKQELNKLRRREHELKRARVKRKQEEIKRQREIERQRELKAAQEREAFDNSDEGRARDALRRMGGRF